MRGFVCFALVCLGGSVFAATPIAGVTAKATSQQVQKLFDPANVCNDNGLSDSGKGDGSQKFTTNGYVGGGCMWHSGYVALGPDEHPIIEFDLGKSFDVGRFHIWNHNGNPSRGFHQVATMISEGGDLYLENIIADWSFAKGRAWARQFNNETEGTHITNEQATLWILGLKTERGGTLIDSRAGSSTEVIGGLSYTTTKGKLAPMFKSTDARVSYTIAEVCYSGDPYTQLVEERRGSETKKISRKTAPLRASFLQGSEIPLFVGKP